MVRGPLVSGAVGKKEPIGFQIIGVYKLVTAGLSLALAFELSRLFKADVRASLEVLIRFMRLDPDNALIHAVMLRLAGIDHQRLLCDRGGDDRLCRPAHDRRDWHLEKQAMGRPADHPGHELADPCRML